MELSIDRDVKTRFPDLHMVTCLISGVKVGKSDEGLEEFKNQLFRQIKEAYNLESLKDLPLFRAYRDFFWSVGIDPTKNRPASEALIRRILAGKPVPRINSLVDAYNCASIRTGVPLAAFDADKLRGSLTVRFAEKGESFLGIGMEKTEELEGKEIVISDSERVVVAVYPYRDADRCKVVEETRNVFLVVCGAPGVDRETLRSATQTTIEYVTMFCGGSVKFVREV